MTILDLLAQFQIRAVLVIPILAGDQLWGLLCAHHQSLNQNFRASLRTMQGFSQALIEDYGDNLDPTTQDYIKRVQRAAAKMDEVVQALIAYNRLSTQELDIEIRSLQAVLDELILRLQPQITATQAEIELEQPLAKVRCDRALLKLILRELLHNALTYVSPDTHPLKVKSGCLVRLNPF